VQQLLCHVNEGSQHADILPRHGARVHSRKNNWLHARCHAPHEAQVEEWQRGSAPPRWIIAQPPFIISSPINVGNGIKRRGCPGYWSTPPHQMIPQLTSIKQLCTCLAIENFHFHYVIIPTLVSMVEEKGLPCKEQWQGQGYTRLVIPVFRNLFFGPKKAFLTGFLRIFFFPAFS